MMSMFDQLAEPFPVNKIHWRVGATTADKTKGIALAYIDARDVMDRLDEVVGPENWQDRYPFVGCCDIGIKVNDEWVWKSNGAGETDIEGAKGQYSDAFKRAAVMWGVARYLYALPNVWCELEARGRTHVIKNPPSLPAWAQPGAPKAEGDHWAMQIASLCEKTGTDVDLVMNYIKSQGETAEAITRSLKQLQEKLMTS